MTNLEKLKKLDIQTALLFEKLESENDNKLDYSKNNQKNFNNDKP